MSGVESPSPRGGHWVRRGLGVAAAALVLGASGLAVYFARSEPDPARAAADILMELEQGRVERADDDLARLARRLGPTSAVWLLRARVAEARGRLDEALASVSHVSDDDRQGAVARLKEGEWERRSHHLRAAEGAFLRCLKLAPQMKLARLHLTYIYGLQLRAGEIREQYQRLDEQEPLAFRDLCHWCGNWAFVEKPAETVAALSPVVAADPGDVRSRLVLVEALRLLGRQAEAESVSAGLPAAGPQARAARVRLALDRGDTAAAESLAGSGPADDPDLAALRGRLALGRGNVPAALDQFRRAHDASPDDRDACFGLGHALRLSGRDEEAESILERVRTQDTLHSLVQRAAGYDTLPERELLLSLASCCESLGRVREARAWYRLIIGVDPLDVSAQDGLYRLRMPR